MLLSPLLLSPCYCTPCCPQVVPLGPNYLPSYAAGVRTGLKVCHAMHRCIAYHANLMQRFQFHLKIVQIKPGFSGAWTKTSWSRPHRSHHPQRVYGLRTERTSIREGFQILYFIIQSISFLSPVCNRHGLLGYPGQKCRPACQYTPWGKLQVCHH